jgi:uncharacterized protein
MTATALRLEETPSAAEVIAALEAADRRPDAALRAAMSRAGEIAPAVIELLDTATSGAALLGPQENLLFWGIHVLGAARRTELYHPLMRFLRACKDDDLDRLLGDAKTATLPQIVISVFDGDPLPLLDACADRGVDEYARWNLIGALARLTFDGAIARETTLAFLDRFDREPLAGPDDVAWQGWQDAISLLGLEEMRERLRAACREGRFRQDAGELEFCLNQLTVARNLEAGDAALFVRANLAAIDDPVAALAWVSDAADGGEDDELADDDLAVPDPASAFALNAEEIDWLRQFIASRPAGAEAMSVETIDGYYCALAMDPDWNRARTAAATIFNSLDETLGSASEEQLDRAGRLLARHLKTIVTRLDAPYAHVPLLGDSSAPTAQLWVKGFITGMQVAGAEWGHYLASEHICEILAPVLGLSLNDYEEYEGRRMTPELRAETISLLPGFVLALYGAVRFETAMRKSPARSTPAHSTKVGRNAPCPCGSGKKYKRCCGSPGRSVN